GRAPLAAAADRRVPRQPQERGGGPQQRRTARRRRDHRGALPEGVRGQDAVGASGHRGPGVHREGSAAGPEGRDRIRGAYGPDVPRRLARWAARSVCTRTRTRLTVPWRRAVWW